MLQPDGKLCCFSTIVDNFTHCNLTREEAATATILDFDLGPREAAQKVERGSSRRVDDPDGWRASIHRVELAHGKKTAEEVVAEILRESDPLPADAGNNQHGSACVASRDSTSVGRGSVKNG